MKDPSKINKELIDELRKQMSKSERFVKDIEAQYGLLSITDKFHYSESPAKMRRLYED